MSTANVNSDVKVYSRLLAYVLPYWAAFLLSIVGFFLYSVSNVSFMQLIRFIIDSVNPDSPVTELPFGASLHTFFGEGEVLTRNFIPVALVLIAVLRGVSTFIGNYFLSYVSTNLVHNLRCELFDQILVLPSDFYDKNALGHLVAKVTFHVTQVTGAATSAVKIIIREGLIVIAYLAYLLYLNWSLTLIFILVAPVIALLVTVTGRRFRRISERIQNSMGDVTHIASEAIQGYRVVRTFGGAQYERGRFHKVSSDNRRQSLKMVVTSAIATPVIQLLVACAMAVLIWFILDPTLVKMSAGEVVVFITVSGLLAKPIRQLSEVNSTVQKGLAAAEDIFTLFDQSGEQDNGDVVLEDVAGRLEFRDVCFSYNNSEQQVLNHISLNIRAGETIALVGKSGSGKSTLASLVPRFYLPTHGTILLDNKPIESLSLTNLREQIAIVTQHITLFNDTVRRNIAYGTLKNATDDQIVAAAKKAYAWQFISQLSDGLDTIVGDDGVLLSGGQRQRLAIARAFLKDAPILILDEATSALDTESERSIQAALDAVTRDRTTIIIAHRLSTIESADRILVLENGNIAEQGTHLELLSREGTYQQLHHGTDELTADQGTELTKPSVPILLEESVKTTRHDSVIYNAWYSNAWWVKTLQPLAYLYQKLAIRRRDKLLTSNKYWSAPVPVIVVGNINIGGTGKSPFVIWLAQQCLARGLNPGIVSRGYGGISRSYPLLVDDKTDPFLAGDEAVMIAQRTDCPVVVDPDRVSAVKQLLQAQACDLVISDDGLQHYALGRDIEIVLVDAEKGLGNGKCLPAGPLREPAARLSSVDWVFVNGQQAVDLPVQFSRFSMASGVMSNLTTDETIDGDGLYPGPLVHAVAGIANPNKFFDSLRAMGYQIVEHVFPDHHQYQLTDLVFNDTLPVVMTEKDAVKCELLTPGVIHENFWKLQVNVDLAEQIADEILNKAGLFTAELAKTASVASE